MQLCEQVKENQRPRTRGQQLSKTPTKNQLSLDAVLAFIESSGKHATMELGYLWHKHPDLKPSNHANLRDFKPRSGCHRDIYCGL